MVRELLKMKFEMISAAALLTMSVIIIGCSKPVKTGNYFVQHPEELQPEAKRCVVDAAKNIDITKDETCMNVVALEKERCIQKVIVFGNIMGMDCENGPEMLGMAYKGYLL
jgi:hypothetical protein